MLVGSPITSRNRELIDARSLVWITQLIQVCQRVGVLLVHLLEVLIAR
jgi:hypothetical protein